MRKSGDRMEKKNYTRRVKLLYVLDFLKAYSDEEHPVTAAKIMDFLKERSIESGRKAIYDDINALCAYGLDVSRAYAAKDGFFLAEREFEVAEIRLLLDAVASAPFITEKKTRELSKKLLAFLSVHQSNEVAPQLHIDTRLKFKNEQIYYIIDAVNRAIAQNKKIAFTYCHYKIEDNQAVLKKDRDFVISPYALVWANDRYYLVGNYEKYDNLSNYRLDRMKMAQITQESARPHSQVSGYTGVFDTADYVRKNIMMYPGAQCELELLCKNSVLEIMLDRFGSGCEVMNKGKERFLLRTSVYISDGLADWLLPLCDRIHVCAPHKLQVMLEQKLAAIAKTPQEKGLL